MTVADKVVIAATKVATPENKMNFIRVLIGLHKFKRFGKSKSEPAFQVFRKHPVTRGMASYLFMWPVGSLIQQTLTSNEKYDWWRIIRFGLYGAFITAPALYTWVKLATFAYPNFILRIGCAKVSMTWLEAFSGLEAFLETKERLKPSYLLAVTLWPVFLTINFAFFPKGKRILLLSCFSVLWTLYLAHVKNMEIDILALHIKTKEFEDQIP